MNINLRFEINKENESYPFQTEVRLLIIKTRKFTEAISLLHKTKKWNIELENKERENTEQVR